MSLSLYLSTFLSICTSSQRTATIPRHTSILTTLPLTKAPMSADPPRRSELPGSCSRVHGDGFTDDEAIANEFADRLAGIGIGDFVDFVGVQPDFALATANHGGSETLLRPEVDPMISRWLAGYRNRGENVTSWNHAHSIGLCHPDDGQRFSIGQKHIHLHLDRE